MQHVMSFLCAVATQWLRGWRFWNEVQKEYERLWKEQPLPPYLMDPYDYEAMKDKLTDEAYRIVDYRHTHYS